MSALKGQEIIWYPQWNKNKEEDIWRRPSGRRKDHVKLNWQNKQTNQAQTVGLKEYADSTNR